MKKMIAALLCAILGFGAIFVLLISMNWVAFAESDYSYSRRLIKSIENGDYTAVLSILSERPSCVNSLTSPIPKTLCSLVDYRPIYPLIAACCSGDMKMVMYLVEHGADVNCNDGRTPLSLTYSAKVPNWYEISTYLIANGASLDYQTEYSANMSSVLYDIVQVRPGAALEGYDWAFDVGTDMEAAKFGFDYNGVSYMLWAWKGDYINLGAGAEIGIYSGDGWHKEVDTGLAMPMSLTLSHNGSEIINYNPQTPQWWITGFNSNVRGVQADALTATFSVSFSDPGMYNAFRAKHGYEGSPWTFSNDACIATLQF